MAKKVAPIANELAATIMQVLSIAIEKHKDQIEKFFEILPSLQMSVSPISSPLLRSYEKLPLQIQGSILALAEQGWFWDIDMPLGITLKFQEIISEHRFGENECHFEEIEPFLERHFDERLDIIQNAIISKYPHRERFIRLAFNAYERKEYELTILMLFAQADGICEEETDCNFFRNRNDGKPRTANYVEGLASDKFAFALSQVLANKLPISVSQKERQLKSYKGLNRHAVLHGESLDYGTKNNSLKTISLINYVVQVFAYVKAMSDIKNGEIKA